MKIQQARIKHSYPLWFLFPALGIYLTFFIVPNLMSFVFAFTDWNSNHIKVMNYIGLDNFTRLLQDKLFLKAIYNTLFYTVTTALFVNLFGFILAIAVNLKLKTVHYLRTVFFAPFIISPIVIGIIFGAIYNPQHGILNSLLRWVGLGYMAKQWLVDAKYAMLAICAMDIWQSMGFSMVIILAGLQTISKEYYESAVIDGASYFQRLRLITVPLITQSIIVSALLSIIGGLKVFSQVYVLTNGGPMDKTQVIATAIFKSFGNGLFGYSSAMGLTFTVIVSIISISILRLTRRLEVEM